jgi:hypothetical protein
MPLLKCQGDGSRDTHDSHLECVSGNRPLVFSKNARGTVSNDMEMCQKNRPPDIRKEPYHWYRRKNLPIVSNGQVFLSSL